MPRTTPQFDTWTAARIKALRTLRGESTAVFAAHFGVSPRTVEGWEQGRYGTRKLQPLLLQALDRLMKKTRVRKSTDEVLA